jgi:hypothetical protein
MDRDETGVGDLSDEMARSAVSAFRTLGPATTLLELLVHLACVLQSS